MKNLIRLVFLAFFFLININSVSAQSQYEGLCCPQPPGQGAAPTSYEIYEDIQRLSFLGSVLYVAAHPDDENTNLITYLSNHLKAKTSYLSLTRGDGGQNRIGTELREQLGVIRTQELLKARSIDGGQQYFSRANDFGYSKNPEETLEIWDEAKLLEDIVWIIRKVQPDVIINRFDHRTPGTTHGHHTASAILSKKAFSLANDKSFYPQQLDYVSTCQPKRLFLNQSYWFYGGEENFAKIDKSGFTGMDVGVHYYGKGKSNNQMAATSRSQHRCQGMGTTPKLGKNMEYLEQLEGLPLPNQQDIFSGINTSWTRIKGSENAKKLVKKITSEYNFSSPYESLSDLVELHDELRQLEDGYWKSTKSAEVKSLILACTNLHLLATAKSSTIVSGESLEVQIEIVNQSPVELKLKGYNFPRFEKATNIRLPFNEAIYIDRALEVAPETAIDNPYWLNGSASLGMYQVRERKLRGLPETPSQLYVNFLLGIHGTTFEYQFPINHQFTDPVVGQVYEPLRVIPPVSLEATEAVYIFPNNNSQKISIEVKAGRDNINGTLFPAQGKNWKCSPASIDFNLAKKGMSQSFEFELTPPIQQEEATFNPYILMDSIRYDKTLHDIRYQHIPRQMVFLPASAKTVRIDVATRGKAIAYLMGAGDVVPDQLRQIGYDVDVLSSSDITTTRLQGYDALILGIRAYNVIEDIPFRQKAIFDY
ncbi:MAG: LmbE family N-acetylglucosaminyl deacetylase, partial [Nonlabens sp.]